MRKIFQTAPDIPQAIANKAIGVVERHLTVNGARRADELSEESKIRLMRDLQYFFQTELSKSQEEIERNTRTWQRLPLGRWVNPFRRWIERFLRRYLA